ncbi:MAG: 1,4-alpha-glucan branching protein GlgB, partial [Actinomycetia bacterium]|nr:1,4-alpha-glucan branching protein GlgB [Actinomycetes bacterium]
MPGEVLDRLVGGAHHNPHDVLGAHPTADGRAVIRALRPEASAVAVIMAGKRTELARLHDGGVFGAVVDAPPGDYRLAVSYGTDTFTVDDPYRWLPTLGEMDLHLIGEGRHENLWQALGARTRSYETSGGPVAGTSFAVWAPNARGVTVTGDFDHWTGRMYPMRSLGSSGVWEIFVPGVGDGAKYKFRILGRDSVWREKADPMAFATEEPPATASVVFTSRHHWADAEWLTRRAAIPWQASPMSIYEVHLGSWRAGRSYRQLADELADYLTQTGFTHVELLPVAEHPFGGSWGYQVTSYYAPTARFGSPDDFRYLVDRLHRAGIGVIIDWVPAHFPKDEWALARFDGTPLYEHADPRRGEQPDWGTFVFDFGRREVRNFLVANALFWLEEFHIDGLRVDAVASMLYLDYSRSEGDWAPNEYGGRENLDAVAFLQEVNATCYRRAPGIVTIAEESTAWPGVTRPTHLGGLGFGFKWNMGWMHDTLAYLEHEPIHRQYHHNEMTFSMMYAYTENFVLPLSHDEVVHGKRSLLEKIPGDDWQRFATLRALYAY